MSTKKKTIADRMAEVAVLEAAASVVDSTLLRASDVAGETPKAIEAQKAETLDREIRDGFRVMLESKHRLTTVIAEAKSQGIHKLLTDPTTGKAYKSWTAYMVNVVRNLGVDAKSLGRGDRDLMVAVLYGSGMSVQQSADALGTSFGTARRAVKKAQMAGELEDGATETVDALGRSSTRTADTSAAAGKGDAQKAMDRLASLQKFLADVALSTGDVKAIKRALADLGKSLTPASAGEAG